MKDNTNTNIREVKSREDLIELLEDITAVEVTARDNYEKDIATFKNFIITDTIGKIKKDEDKHIAMLENLVSMLRKKSKA